MKVYGVFGSVCKDYPLELMFKDWNSMVPEIYLNKQDADKAFNRYKTNGYICDIIEMEMFNDLSLKIEKKCHQCTRNVFVDDKECWFCGSKL